MKKCCKERDEYWEKFIISLLRLLGMNTGLKRKEEEDASNS